jgi:hypothetical protein
VKPRALRVCHQVVNTRTTYIDTTADTLTQLEQQCAAADQLYIRESKHLQYLQELVDDLTSANDSFRSNVAANIHARDLVRVIASHIQKDAERLLLFAKLNTEAVDRILDKVNRRKDHGGRPMRSAQAFCSPSAVTSLAGWAEDLLISTYASVQGSSGNASAADLPGMIELFIDSYATVLKKHGESSEVRLRCIIHLAGLHQSCSASSEQQSEEDPDTNALSNVWTELVRNEVQSLQTHNQKLDRAILKPDHSGRSSLHYAVQYRLRAVWELLHESCHALTVDANAWPREGSPSLLALAIANSDELMVADLLAIESHSKPLTSLCVRVALLQGDASILAQILAVCVGEKEGDAHERACLPVAAVLATHGDTETCKSLLEAGTMVNMPEQGTGKTALICSCISGNLPLAKLLLSFGADARIPDLKGWLPVEHAAYRGHLEIVAILDSLMEGLSLHKSPEPLPTAPMAKTDRSAASHIPWTRTSPKDAAQMCVWIRLGSNDASTPTRPLQLDILQDLDRLTLLEREAVYTLRVCDVQNPSLTYESALPIIGSNVNEPWLFYTSDVSKMRLRWELFKNSRNDINGQKLVGTGIVLMHMLNTGVRQVRESLIRNTTTPLQDPRSLDVIGSVTFSFFWITPHPPPDRLNIPHAWEVGKGLGGHRGSDFIILAIATALTSCRLGQEHDR